MAIKRRNHWLSTSATRKRRRLIDRICCEICEDLFLSQGELKSHQFDRHKGNQWRCDHCGLELKFSRSDLGKYTHDCGNNPLVNERLSPKTPMVKEKIRFTSTMEPCSPTYSNHEIARIYASSKSGKQPRKRIRMSRCGKCIGCNSKNCGKCYKCLDMVKYGGPGTLKQACEKRQCINPQMPGLPSSNYIKSSLKGTSPNKFYPMENCEGSSITAEQISAENEDAHIPSDVLGSLKLSSKKSAVLPTTFAAYLALEAAAAKYAPKVVSNLEEIAKNKWWDSIEAAGDHNESKRKHMKKIKNISIDEDKDCNKENPYDFYKFAEQTAETIKDNGDRSQSVKQNYSLPPRWLNKRPKITYSKMCKQAIQNSPSGRANLKSIYEYIMENYSYYKELDNPRGWQIAIRNTLKLNKAFVRQRTDSESRVGRQGNTWALDPRYTTTDGFKRVEFSVLDESIWDLNRDIYATVNSREAIYDSDDSFYKSQNDDELGDSDSDYDTIPEYGPSKFGENFINGAISAAESIMNRTPGRKLLSSIGAASKRHKNGLDNIRHNPLGDFLGLQNCELERDNYNRHFGGDNGYNNRRLKNYRLLSNHSSEKLACYEKYNEVPKLSLLASAAIARETYKSRKPTKKNVTKKEDVVEMQNVIIESNISEGLESNLDNADLSCLSCRTSGERNIMLLCAVCQKYCHMFCLDDKSDSIPEGWSEETWNILTDWNKCEDEDSNKKLCEIVRKYKEWICKPCTSKALLFYGHDYLAVKTKSLEFPGVKRRNSVKRDKGEVNIMTSHLPTPLKSTEPNFQSFQDSWKMVPNEVVADVSNIDIVLLENENEPLIQNQIDEGSNSDYKTNNLVCKSKIATATHNNIDQNGEIMNTSFFREATSQQSVVHCSTPNQSFDSGQLNNKHSTNVNATLLDKVISRSSNNASLTSSFTVNENRNENEEPKNTFILKEMNQNLTFGNNTMYAKDLELTEKCDSLNNTLTKNKITTANDIISKVDE